jgi:hypothetical protein
MTQHKAKPAGACAAAEIDQDDDDDNISPEQIKEAMAAGDEASRQPVYDEASMADVGRNGPDLLVLHRDCTQGTTTGKVSCMCALPYSQGRAP